MTEQQTDKIIAHLANIRTYLWYALFILAIIAGEIVVK